MTARVGVSLAAALGVLLLAVAGCGDGDGDSPPNDGPPAQNADNATGSGGADIQPGAGLDPASVDECAIGVDAIRAALGADARDHMGANVPGCFWEGADAAGSYLELSIDVDDADSVLEEASGPYYKSLDGLGDKAYIQDEMDVVSIRWEHDGLGVLLQEQYGEWEPDDLITIAHGIDDDLP